MQRRNGGARKYAASVTQGCAANANGLRTPRGSPKAGGKSDQNANQHDYNPG
jgi:hypothetical protein